MSPWQFWQEPIKDKNPSSQQERVVVVGKGPPMNAYNTTPKTSILYPHFKSNKLLNLFDLWVNCSSPGLPLSPSWECTVLFLFLVNLLLSWLIWCVLELFPMMYTKNSSFDNISICSQAMVERATSRPRAWLSRKNCPSATMKFFERELKVITLIVLTWVSCPLFESNFVFRGIDSVTMSRTGEWFGDILIVSLSQTIWIWK